MIEIFFLDLNQHKRFLLFFIPLFQIKFDQSVYFNVSLLSLSPQLILTTTTKHEEFVTPTVSLMMKPLHSSTRTKSHETALSIRRQQLKYMLITVYLMPTLKSFALLKVSLQEMFG